MALVDVDSWITEFESCERLSQDIQSQIVQRNNLPKLSEEYYRISATIRVRIRQFKSELTQLLLKLEQNFQSGKLTIEEQERRQRQIESLQSTLIHLEKQFVNVGETSRNELYQSNVGPTAKTLWDDDDDELIGVGRKPERPVSTNELRQQQIQILENQNEGLEALSNVISRQKHLAIRIGEEVDNQNEIIDNLADTMERTDGRMNTETQNIGIVTRKDKTCGYWIVIIILFIAIVITSLL